MRDPKHRNRNTYEVISAAMKRRYETNVDTITLRIKCYRDLYEVLFREYRRKFAQGVRCSGGDLGMKRRRQDLGSGGSLKQSAEY